MARLSTRGFLLAIGAALCSAAGIVLVKIGLGREASRIAPLAAGIVTYCAGIVFGMVLIGRYAISVAYPVVVGLSLVMLAAISSVVLGEVLTPQKVGGTLLILVGVVMLVRSDENMPRA